MVTITNAAAVNFKVNAPIPPTDSFQTATFGANTAAGTGGWRPQLADNTVESLVGYGGLVSGSLGSHVPTISSGRLTFTGAAGCPNGAVLRLVGLSGRVYEVTMAQVASRRDIATNADVNAASSIGANLGLTVVVRQNARIPARSRLVGGTEWLSGASQGDIDSGVGGPITLIGEGPVLPGDTGFAASLAAGEYHCYGIRSFFPSSITIRRLKFADQKTDHSLLVESSASRINRNITVEQCYFRIDYDIDGVGNWTDGFNSTGHQAARLIFVTGGYTRDLIVKDNIFIGGYVSSEINFGGTLIHSGNYFSHPYFDYRKTTQNGNIQYEGCRIEGADFFGNPSIYSVNEDVSSAPHLDVDQTSGPDVGAVMVYDEARIVWHNNAAPFQSRFYSDRATAFTNGYRWSFAGDMQLCNSPHIATVDYADNVVVDRLFVIPNNLVGFPVTGAVNRVLFGTAKPSNGGTIGAHRIDNSVYGTIGYDVRGPTSGDVTETNVVKYNGQSAAYFSTRLAQWANWGSLPVEPTYAEALAYFEPVNASDFDTKSPFDYVTAGSPLQSDYTISNTLRPVPVLSSLTVTTVATAAFTVVTNIASNSTVHWAVFASNVTDPLAIVKGINGTTAALQQGLVHRGNSAGTVTGPGGPTLSAGTYWLCVAQYNGPKKSHVQTVSFVVPS